MKATATFLMSCASFFALIGLLKSPASAQAAQSSQLLGIRIQTLKPKVLSDKRAALREALLLRSKVDGALALDLYIMIGRVIKLDATMFLQELADTKDMSRVDANVGALGSEYVDRFEDQLHELRARKQALQMVSEKRLVAPKMLCITKLDGQIRTIKDTMAPNNQTAN